MKVVKLKNDIYKKAEKVSRTYGIEVNTLISLALNQGLEVINEETVLGLYRDRKITLQKAAEMLSLSIWDMIEKIKEADIHINYSRDELAEDLK